MKRWSDDEMETVAMHFVALWREDPFQTQSDALQKAQDMGLPKERHHSIHGLGYSPALTRKIKARWREALKTHATPIAAAPPEPVEPQLIYLEVPQKPDYQKILAELDVPSLVALLLAKLGGEWATLSAGLLAIAERAGTPLQRNGHARVPNIVSAVAPPPKPRVPRIALVGPSQSQFVEINQAVEQFTKPIRLYCLNRDRASHEVPVYADAVVLTSTVSHKWYDNAKTVCPHQRIHFVPGGQDTVVQKLRDLASMNWGNEVPV